MTRTDAESTVRYHRSVCTPIEPADPIPPRPIPEGFEFDHLPQGSIRTVLEAIAGVAQLVDALASPDGPDEVPDLLSLALEDLETARVLVLTAGVVAGTLSRDVVTTPRAALAVLMAVAP